MSNNPYANNPFGSPYAPSPSSSGPSAPRGTMGKVMAPGIALCVIGGLALCLALFNVVFAAISEPQQVDPNAPEFVKQMAQNSVGPVAVVVQGALVVLNIVVLLGGVMMIRTKMWGLALTASILAMVDIESCCCIIGLPIGIWSLVILMQSDVQNAFKANS